MRTRRFALPAMMVGALLLVGCLETKLKLVASEQAKVDPKYVGDWRFDDKDGGDHKSTEMLILNFNDREYYVEWKEGGEKTTRMNGIITDVKGATFAQLKGITDDGTIEEKNMIVRVAIKDGKLSIRQLKEEFFEGVSTDEQLKSKLADNIDNAGMYDGDELLAAKVAHDPAK